MACKLENGSISPVYTALERKYKEEQATSLYSNIVVPFKNGTLSPDSSFSRYMKGLELKGIEIYEEIEGEKELVSEFVTEFFKKHQKDQERARTLVFLGIVPDGNTKSDLVLEQGETYTIMQGLSVNFFEVLFEEGLNIFELETNAVKKAFDRAFEMTVQDFRTKIRASAALKERLDAKKDRTKRDEAKLTMINNELIRLIDVGTSLKLFPSTYKTYFINKHLKEQGIEIYTQGVEVNDIVNLEVSLEESSDMGETTQEEGPAVSMEDNEVYVEAFQNDPQNNMPKSVKRILYGIPETNRKGAEIREEKFGMRIPKPFGTVFSKLASELANKGTDPNTFIKTLENLKDPAFQVVLSRLRSNSFNPENVNYKSEEEFHTALLTYNILAAFTQQFAKHQYDFQSLLLELNGNAYFANSNTDRLQMIIKDTFSNNFDQNLNKYFKRTLNEDSGGYNLDRLINDLNDAYTKRDYKKYLSLLGIEFSNPELYTKPFVTKNGSTETVKDIVIDINSVFKKENVFEGNKNSILDIHNRSVSVIGVQVNKLINLETKFSESQVNLGHLNEENKLLYDINLNTFLTILSNEINANSKNPVKLAELYPKLFGPNPTAFAENSVWAKLIKQGRQINVGMLSGVDIKNGEAAGKTSKDLSEPDRFLQKVVGALEGKFAFIRAADRGNENYIAIEGYGMKSLPEVRQIMQGYFKDEVKAIYKLIKQGTGDNVVHYSKFKDGKQIGNGIYFRVFEELNKNTPEEQLSFLEKEIFPNIENGELNFKIDGKEVNAIINDKLKKIAEDEVRLAVEYGFLQYTGQKYRSTKDSFMLPSQLTDNELVKNMHENNPEFGKAGDSNTRKKVIGLKLVGINNFIANIEQTKLFVGDPALFKNENDFFKRMSMMNSTKEISLTDNKTNTFLKNMEFTLEKNAGFDYSTDSELVSGRIRSITISDKKEAVTEETKQMLRDIFTQGVIDQYSKSGLSASELNDKIEEKVEGYLDAYTGMEIADAQAYITLDEYKRLRIRAGQWTPSHERTYQRLVKNEPVNPEDLKALSVLKYQYTGLINSKESDIHIVGGRKFSFFPLIPQLLPKGSNLEKLNNEMLKTGTGMAFMQSAAKFGHNINTYSFLNEEGDFGISLNKDSTFDMLDYRFMGDQLKINDKEKKEISQSTQFRKIIFANFFENGELTAKDPSLRDDLLKLAELQSNLVNEGWEALVEELDLNNLVTNLKSDQDIQKTVDAIKKRFFEKGVSANMLEAIDRIGDIGLLDIVPGKIKLEHTIMSMFRKAVMNKKRPGESMAQVSSQGFETEKGTTAFKWYRKNNEGELLPMQIGIPLPKKLIPWVISNFGTEQEKKNGTLSSTTLERFNEAVAKDEENFEKDGKVTTFTKIRRITGFRIPFQAHSSGDVAHITKFFDPSFATGVVVPKEMVAKTGSDFDIDKFNMYYNNYKVVEKDWGLDLELEKDDIVNQMNTLEQRITLHPENQKQLLMPIDSTTLKDIVKRQRSLKSKKDSTESTGMKSIFSTRVQIDKANTYLSGKAGVGQVAVHVTNLAIAQMTEDLRIDATILRKFPEFKQGKLMTYVKTFSMGKRVITKEYASLSRQTDVNGNSISEILSELLTAYVDIAKDAYIFDLNATQEVANTMLLLLRTGLSPDTVFDFINQPIIREYFKVKKYGQSFAYRASHNGINKSSSDPLFSKVAQETRAIMFNKVDPSGKAFKTFETKIKKNPKYFEYLSHQTINPENLNKGLSGDLNTVGDIESQISILNQFLDLQTTSMELQKFIRITSPDTKYFKDFSQANYQVSEGKEYNPLLQKPLPTIDNAYKAVFEGAKNPMVKATFDAKKEYVTKMNNLSIAYNGNFSDLIDIIKGLAVSNTFGQIKQDRIRQEVEYAFVGYLYGLALNGKNRIKYGEIFEELVQPEDIANSVAYKIKNMKKSPMTQFLLPLLARPDKANSTNSVKVLSRQINESEADLITSELIKLRESNFSLYNDIVKLALIQSPMRLGQFNLLQFIPAEHYYNIVETVLRKVKSQDGHNLVDGKDFAKEFWLANPELVWNSFTDKGYIEAGKNKNSKLKFKTIKGVSLTYQEEINSKQTIQKDFDEESILRQVQQAFDTSDIVEEEESDFYGFGQLGIIGVINDTANGVYYFIDGINGELIRANGEGNKFKLYHHFNNFKDSTTDKIINRFKEAVKEKEINC